MNVVIFLSFTYIRFIIFCFFYLPYIQSNFLQSTLLIYPHLSYSFPLFIVFIGDLKPLNFVRTHGTWSLIDFDAAAVIGIESVGFKSSSAYAPPEAVIVDEGSYCCRY